jgi:hypothetical protein
LEYNRAIELEINGETLMAKILITTQIYENYAAHDWDGEGKCPDYWKAKGGNEYVIKNIKINEARAHVDRVQGQITEDSPYFREFILNWEVVADNYLTEFERDQLEYEGRIIYSPVELAA